MAELLRRRGEFIHRRYFPDLPPGYDDWEAQKRLYCKFNSDTIRKAHAGYPRIQHKLRPAAFGLVFCHRGYYERAARIVENSLSAIAWGFANDLFLHEVDCRFGSESDQSNYQFLAHDLSPQRVTSWRLQDWSELVYEQVHGTQLVSRRVNLDNIDFASTYLRAHEKVPRLRQAMHMDHTIPYGLQIDLREDDLAKAIVEFTSHYPKVKNPRARMFISETEYQRQNVILKGYNVRFASYGMLIHRARQYSRTEYGRQFSADQLFECPNLTMVFYADPLIDLAMQRKGMDLKNSSHKDRWDLLSLEYLTQIAREQIFSFVDIEIGEGVYNFILEIVYSGLGLGYHGYPEARSVSGGTAHNGRNRMRRGPANPLTGEPLDESDLETLFESRVDRAMIDVSLELRNNHPGVVLSSCTRLPDVITPDGVKYGTRYDNGSLRPWPEGQRGLSRKLRALHGGLYPQSDLVVADDPAAEVAARTWIDQYSSLNRSDLLEKPYYEWLKAEPEVHDAILELNNGEFLANKCEEYDPGENEAQRTQRIEMAMNRMYEGLTPVGDMDPVDGSSQNEAQDTEVIGEGVTGQQIAGNTTTDRPAARRQAASSAGERSFQHVVEQFEAKERRERKQRMEWKRNASAARSRGDRMRTRVPPPSEVKRRHNENLLRRAEYQSERELEQARERRQQRYQRAPIESAEGPTTSIEGAYGPEQSQHGNYLYGQNHNYPDPGPRNSESVEMTAHSRRDQSDFESRDNNQNPNLRYQGNLHNSGQGYASNIAMNSGTRGARNGSDGRNDDDDGCCSSCFCCCSNSDRER